jgi:hypothetical protein
MRRSFNLGSLALFLITVMWVTVQGCRTVATPTFPATSTPSPTNTQPAPTNTRTFTPTFTNTGTNTNTRTPTNTPTVTYTPTFTNTAGGPTDTFTDTPTNTNTFTITFTPTVTYTFTDTDTPGAATNTPTACPPQVLTSYTFDTCAQGWSLDASAITGEIIGYSATTYHTGPGAWQAYIPFDSTNNNEEININFPCGTFVDMSNAAVTMWVYSTVACNAQMFCNYGTDPSTCYAGYQNPGYCNGPGCAGGQTGSYATVNASTWTMVYFKPALTAPDGQYISKFGVNILNCNSPATIYIDDVSITSLAPPTATPTGCVPAPTFTPAYPFTWNNDAYCTLPAGWSTNDNSTGISVPGLALSTAQNYTPACSTGCGSLLAGPIPFTAANQAANVEYVFPNGTTGTDITGKTISAYYYLDVTPSNGGYGQVYIQTGANSLPTYNYQSTLFTLVTGAWTQVSIPANQGGVDPANIWKFGFQIGSGSGATSGFQNVNFYIDDITIQ